MRLFTLLGLLCFIFVTCSNEACSNFGQKESAIDEYWFFKADTENPSNDSLDQRPQVKNYKLHHWIVFHRPHDVAPYTIDYSIIKERQYQTLSDALHTVPGIHTQQAGGLGGQTALYVRGNETHHSNILLEGRQLNGGFSNSINPSFINAESLSSIQIVKGPSTSSKGIISSGGYIQLELEHTETPNTIQAAYGSYHTKSVFTHLFQKDHKLALSINAKTLDTQNKNKNNKFNKLFIAPKATYSLSDSSTIELLVYALSARQGLPGDNNKPTFPNSTDFQRSQSFLISPGIHFGKEDPWRGQAFYAFSQDRLVSDADTFYIKSTTHFHGFKTSTTYQDGETFQPTLGLSTNRFYFTQLDRNTGAQIFETEWTQLTPWLQSVITPFKSTTIKALSGYQYNSRFKDKYNQSLEISQKLGLTSFIFAKAGYTSSPPNGNQLAMQRSQKLQPETNTTYECGCHKSFFEEQLDLGFTIFKNDIRNHIDIIFNTTSNRLETTNTAKVKTQGIEISARYNPKLPFSLYTNYTYLEAIRRTPIKTRLLRRPRHQINTGITLYPTTKSVIGTEIGLTANRLDVNGQTGAIIKPNHYWTSRTYGSWRFKKNWQLQARLENVFNQKYEPIVGFPALKINMHIGLQYTY